MPSKRRSYTAKFKLTAVKYAEDHGNRAAGRHFDVTEKMIRTWRQSTAKLQAMKSNKKADRGKKSRRPVLEGHAQGVNCGVTAGNLLAEAALFNNLDELVIGMPVEDSLHGSSTEAPSSAGAEESSDTVNSIVDVKPEPPSSPGEVTCDNRSIDPEPEHEGNHLHEDDEAPCRSRSTQTGELSPQNASGEEEEDTSDLLTTQREILHVLKRLANAQEKLVQLKAWKYGVKMTDDGICYERESAERSRKNGLQTSSSSTS